MDICITALFAKPDLTTCTESLLQEIGGTNTDKTTIHHNTDAITKNLSLIHVMCGDNDYSFLLISLDHLLNTASGRDIQPSRRFVQKY